MAFVAAALAAMDKRKIILCDLSKGAIGADNAMLLGSLIVMQEKLAALSGGDIPESERVPHLLFAEEAQNYIGDFESILSETRKFNLAIAIATQAIDSLSRETATAIFTNAVKTKIARFLLGGTGGGSSGYNLDQSATPVLSGTHSELILNRCEPPVDRPRRKLAGFHVHRYRITTAF